MCSKTNWFFKKSPAYMSLFHPTRLFNLRKSSYLHDYSILHKYLIHLWKSLISILTNLNYTRVKNTGRWVYLKEIFIGTKLILKEGKFIRFNKIVKKLLQQKVLLKQLTSFEPHFWGALNLYDYSILHDW